VLIFIGLNIDSAENLPARRVTEDGIPMQDLVPHTAIPDTADVLEPNTIEPSQRPAVVFVQPSAVELRIIWSIVPPY
jgi:hypothetical protein